MHCSTDRTSLGVGLAALLGLAGCAGLARNGEAYRIDPTVGMRQRAHALAGSTVTPAWQTTLACPELDELIVRSDGSVLVGLLDLSTRYRNAGALVPHHGPYVLVDVATGAPRWEHDRERHPDVVHSVVSAEPEVVYVAKRGEETKIVVLDEADGTVRWDRTYDGGATHIRVDRKHGALLVAIAGRPGRIDAIDVRSGERRWAATLDALDTAPLIDIAGRAVFVAGGGVRAFDATTGDALWRHASSSGSHATALVVDGTQVITAHADGAVRGSLIDGTGAWTKSVDGYPELLTIEPNRVLVASLVAPEESGHTLHALDRTDGAALWSHAVGDELKSAIAVVDSLVCFTVASDLVWLDAECGEPHGRQALSGRAARRLPDRLETRDGRIVVVSESAVSAHDPSRAEAEWLTRLSGVGDLVSCTARRDVELSAGIADPTDHVARDQSARMRSMQGTTDALEASSRRAFQRYQNVVQRTSSKIHSSDAGERADAYFERRLAAEHSSNVQTINDAFADVSFAANTALGVLAAGEQVESNAQQGANAAFRDRALVRLRMASKMHERAIQGDWLVRPFRDDRVHGVILVHLGSGEWGEILSSPSESILEDEGNLMYLNFQLAVIDEENARLVTKGTGFDSERWVNDERYEANALQESMFAWALDSRYRTTMVKRSLLAFDMDTMELAAPEAYGARSVTRRRSRILSKR